MWVFSFALKESKLVADLTSPGSSFQSLGPLTLKARLMTRDEFVKGTLSTF
jgi:hypothetical protein